MEGLTEEEIKKKAQENIEKIAKEAAEKKINESVAEEVEKSFEGKEFISKESAQEIATKTVEVSRKEFEKKMNEAFAEFKKKSQITKSEEKKSTFNDNLAEAIEKNADNIRSFKKGSSEIALSMKAVGDMSIPNNFPGATPFIQDVRGGLIINPYNRVWLSDILPQGRSTGNSVLFPRENGGEGGVAPWLDHSQDKSQVDWDFDSMAAFFKWIAGYVIVDREMLDDIDWLTSYLQAKLLVSLKTAENNFILNGTTDTNPVEGLLTVATQYNGDFINPVDRIIDSAYGQIVEDTHEFYYGNSLILNPRAAVGIGLNKADGSGEYDLPAGSVAFRNGNLDVGGLTSTTTTGMDKEDFLSFDRNAIMFLNRLEPEIRMFEDSTLAKRNKVMFRIEERVTQAIFNTDAIVTGKLKV